MKLLILLGILLSAIYGEKLDYGSDISRFTGAWKNPDVSNGEETGFADGTLLSDGDLATGYALTIPDNNRVWGIQGSTKGMTGDFAAEIKAPAGFAYWDITKASISFASTDCVPPGSTVTASYTTPAGTQGIVDVTSITGAADANYVVTFTLEPATALKVKDKFTFQIETGAYCEGGIEIREFALEGIPVATSEPSRSPTKLPTATPTTLEPTMAPTKQCKGQVAWGDPHFTPIPMAKDEKQFNYQGIGWYYYLFPCDMKDYEEWPFFIQAKHNRCWWKGNPKGCVGNNRLILNTKPKPWVITYTGKGFDITVGTDVNGQTANNFNTKKQYSKRNPLVINYNDGQTNAQYGTLKIFYNPRGTIVLQLENIALNGYPRRKCDGIVIDIRNSGSWLAFTCPTCLRNIACGLMGKYTRGDCTRKQMGNQGNKCYDVFVGSNGNVYTPPTSDKVFGQFADTWHEDKVEQNIKAAGKTPITFLKERADYTPLHHINNVHPELEGRAFEVEDASFYDGYCKDNMDKIREVNETCRLNTVVKYEKCCQEIGICSVLWKGCIEDLCACTAPAVGNNTFTEQQCLDVIIHDSMNTTCSYDLLYPTATPTGAPTKHPVSLVAGLPKGTKAEDLIWLYLIFVVLFVVIAGAAYWYYRKKNVGKVSMEDDEEMGIETGTVQASTDNQTFTQD